MNSASSGIKQNFAPLSRAHNFVLAFLVGTLSVSVELKIFNIQYLELIFIVDFLLLLYLFAKNRLQMRVFQPFFSIAKSYGVFLMAAFLLAVIALRQEFYPFSDVLLKRPLIITMSRMVELFLDVFFMLYLASLYREDERLCAFGAKVYYWMGIASGIYSLASFPLNYLYDMQLGTYLDSHRMRGFNNEGGSYGTYLLTVCALAVAMYHRGWLSRRQLRWGMPLLVICLVGSQSKAAFFAALLLSIFYLMWRWRGWKRWALITAICAVFASLGAVVNLAAAVDVYVKAAAAYQQVSNLRSNDANMVMGRVSGLVLAPRMIATHPLLGIGWGNYPLVRDDPQYRQGSAFSLGDLDSPSLGPIDYIVELGFPLWLYLIWVSFKPVYLLQRHRVDPWILCMAVMQPLANWFGAHLNLTYQWVVVGLALGMGFSRSQDAKTEIAS